MENSLKTVYSNAKQPDPDQKNNPQISKENPVPLAWFAVNLEIVKAEWDPKIKDWAYEQNFVISVYDIPSVATPYAPDLKRYYGAFKRYDYYFTGQNSEVLDYSLQFDNLYFNTVLGIESKDFKVIGTTDNPGAEREGQQTAQGGGSGSSTGNTQTTSNSTGQKSDPPPPGSKDTSAGTATAGGTSVTPGLKSNSDRTGSLAVGLEAQNSIVTSLHDVSAFAEGKIKIIGDPDWLVMEGASTKTEYSKFYGSNGYTVNPSGGQVFIEVAFKEAMDYKNRTGTMELNESILFMNYPDYVKEMAKGAVVWRVKDVDSVFSSGKFEQTLSLVGALFDAGAAGDSGTEGNTGTQSPQNSANPDDDYDKDLQIDEFDDLDTGRG